MTTHITAGPYRLPRIEGEPDLVQDNQGRIRLIGRPTVNFEAMMRQRTGMDAAMRCQHICADGGISHLLATLLAWEDAANQPVAENGQALRDILHNVALLHAHLRHFYLQLLPDYLPESSLRNYEGGNDTLLRVQDVVNGRASAHWIRHAFPHPFSEGETDRLWEHRTQALEALARLQRMAAVIGGKFPMVMSLVPGGVNLSLNEADIILLRRLLGSLKLEWSEIALEDATLLTERYPKLAKMGLGAANLVSAGSGEEDSVLDGGAFPSGILLEGKLEPFTAAATESIERAYYRMPGSESAGGLPHPDPLKEDAYSWIKAPRYQGNVLETGPVARIAIAYLSGVRLWNAGLVDLIEEQVQQPITQANTVAGRILARMGEVGGLLRRIESLLDQLDPSQPTVSSERTAAGFSGEGAGYVEAPAGALTHRVVVEKGRIVHYDIVAPCTWNGASEGQDGKSGPLETALNRTEHDLSDPAQRRELSRIVQSFAFSMRDAVH